MRTERCSDGPSNGAEPANSAARALRARRSNQVIRSSLLVIQAAIPPITGCAWLLSAVRRTDSGGEQPPAKRSTRMKLKFALTVALLSSVSVYAQQRGTPAAPPPVPRVAAPIELAGYWVAIVSEDWRWRMGVGLKGDYGYLTLSPEGRKVGDSWDP